MRGAGVPPGVCNRSWHRPLVATGKGEAATALPVQRISLKTSRNRVKWARRPDDCRAADGLPPTKLEKRPPHGRQGWSRCADAPGQPRHALPRNAYPGPALHVL